MAPFKKENIMTMKEFLTRRNTNDCRPVLFITHDGKFHADEVMATAILQDAVGDAATGSYMIRISHSQINAAKELCDVFPGSVIYDIGDGKYDHHETPLYRENGVPYASAGLVWKDFARKYIAKCAFVLNDKSIEKIIDGVDTAIMQPIDAADNGLYNQDMSVPVLSFSTIVGVLNHTDELSGAINMARMMLKAQVESLVDAYLASEKVRSALKGESNSYGMVQDGILVLNEGLPWMDAIIHPSDDTRDIASTITHVIHPSANKWVWRAVNTNGKGSPLRVETPKRFCGLRGMRLIEEMRMTNEAESWAAGWENETFIHANGFMGMATSRDAAILIVLTILECAGGTDQ